MSINDHLRQTLTYYREQRLRHLERLRPVEIMIRQLESELGETSENIQLPEAAIPFTLLEMNGEQSPQGNGKKAEVRGDEFFGMSQAEAARAYVSKVGHAVELSELVEMLNKGGCRVGGADPDRTLYIALIRNTKDFVRVPNGFIGLRSMYPGLKPGAAGAGKPKDKPKGKTKGKAKAAKKKRAAPTKAASKKAKAIETAPTTPEKPPAHEPIPIKATVQEVLADGQFQHKDAIVQRVQEKVGPSARSFTIIGVLNKEKYFERQGDQFRVRPAA
jgi:hypothetical protein